MGYDTEDIKKRCRHEWNPELGHTYGCAIHEEERAKVETLARQQVLQLEENAKALKSLKSLDVAPAGGRGEKVKKQKREAVSEVVEDSEPEEEEADTEQESSSQESSASEEMQPVKSKKRSLEDARRMTKQARKHT